MTATHPTPEQELASAYLDGDVTAAERARVEATPELRSLVASMREAKKLMAAVPVVGDAVRDATIASALAQFGAAGGNVVSLDSRRRWPSKVLSAAAAVVVVGVVGVTVMQSKGDDKSSTAERNSEPKFEADTADDSVGAGTPDTAVGESGGTEILATASPLVIDDPEQLLLLTLPEPLPPTADNGTDTTMTAATEAPSQTVESYNFEALACMSDDQVFLADIYYQGALAIAVRDTVTGVTEAIDSNCTVLASVSP